MLEKADKHTHKQTDTRTSANYYMDTFLLDLSSDSSFKSNCDLLVAKNILSIPSDVIFDLNLDTLMLLIESTLD